MMDSAIASEAQKLATDRLVKLYTIDATALGGSVYRFVSSIDATLDVASLISTGTTATCVTSTPHTMATGDSVRISDAIPAAYNGDFTATVTNSTTFTYTLLSDPVNTATGIPVVTRLNNVMTFGGNDYTPIAFEATGFERIGQGTQPTPKIRVSNVNRVLMAGIITLDSLTGATFTRIRTFRKHLDDGTDPDSTAIFPIDVYRVNRKTVQNKVFVEFDLATSLDQEGVRIPKRQCLKSACTHQYRIYDSDAMIFNYTNATCPYAASTYFTSHDVATSDPALDKCGKHLSSCKARFGTAPLPTRAFPGVGGR